MHAKYSSSSGTELPLVSESYDLLNDIFPFPSILDAGYPILEPSFDKCPVWRYSPIGTWVFLVIFYLEDSI